MRTFLLVLIALSSTSSLVSFAQSDSIRRPDIIRFADVSFRNVISPFQSTKKGLVKAGIVLLATSASTFLDGPINKYLINRNDPVLNVVNDVGNHYGKPYSAFIVTGGFYITGLIVGNEWARETGLVLGTALLTSGLIESNLKPLIGRARPGHQMGNFDFHPLKKGALFHSFPSGHASIAFTITLVLAQRIHNTPLKVFFYSLAAATAFCRLYSNAHWFSDVVFGGAVGWFSSSASMKNLFLNKYRKKNSTNISFNPSTSGLSLILSFR